MLGFPTSVEIHLSLSHSPAGSSPLSSPPCLCCRLACAHLRPARSRLGAERGDCVRRGQNQVSLLCSAAFWHGGWGGLLFQSWSLWSPGLQLHTSVPRVDSPCQKVDILIQTCQFCPSAVVKLRPVWFVTRAKKTFWSNYCSVKRCFSVWIKLKQTSVMTESTLWPPFACAVALFHTARKLLMWFLLLPLHRPHSCIRE